MDYYSDASFQKFLDDKHPLSQNYEADDIVNINSDFTSNKSSNFKLRKKTAEMSEQDRQGRARDRWILRTRNAQSG